MYTEVSNLRRSLRLAACIVIFVQTAIIVSLYFENQELHADNEELAYRLSASKFIALIDTSRGKHTKREFTLTSQNDSLSGRSQSHKDSPATPTSGFQSSLSQTALHNTPDIAANQLPDIEPVFNEWLETESIIPSNFNNSSSTTSDE